VVLKPKSTPLTKIWIGSNVLGLDGAAPQIICVEVMKRALLDALDPNLQLTAPLKKLMPNTVCKVEDTVEPRLGKIDLITKGRLYINNAEKRRWYDPATTIFRFTMPSELEGTTHSVRDFVL
jgi:hypothetical protein